MVLIVLLLGSCQFESKNKCLVFKYGFEDRGKLVNVVFTNLASQISLNYKSSTGKTYNNKSLPDIEEIYFLKFPIERISPWDSSYKTYYGLMNGDKGDQYEYTIHKIKLKNGEIIDYSMKDIMFNNFIIRKANNTYNNSIVNADGIRYEERSKEDGSIMRMNAGNVYKVKYIKEISLDI